MARKSKTIGLFYLALARSFERLGKLEPAFHSYAASGKWLKPEYRHEVRMAVIQESLGDWNDLARAYGEILNRHGEDRSTRLLLNYALEQCQKKKAERGTGISAEQKGINLLLVNDTDFRTNIGCRLTSVSLKEMVRRSFVVEGKAIHIESAPYNFLPHAHSTTSVARSHHRDFIDMVKHAIGIEYAYETLRRIEEADIVLFQPEGTLGDDAGMDEVVTFFSPLVYAILLGKKTACINGTIPSFQDKRREFIESVLKYSTGVALRDRRSANFYGTNFLPDAALTYIGERHSGEVRNHVLITTSARRSLESDIEILRVALEFCAEKNFHPLVLTKDSRKFLSERQNILKSGGVFAETASLADAVALLNRCAIHIGGRYHMSILAATLGVPSVINEIQTGKNNWLAEEFDVIALARSPNEIKAAARELLDNAASGTANFGTSREKLVKEYQEWFQAFLAKDTPEKPALSQLPEIFEEFFRSDTAA